MFEVFPGQQWPFHTLSPLITIFWESQLQTWANSFLRAWCPPCFRHCANPHVHPATFVKMQVVVATRDLYQLGIFSKNNPESWAWWMGAFLPYSFIRDKILLLSFSLKIRYFGKLVIFRVKRGGSAWKTWAHPILNTWCFQGKLGM